VKVAPEPPVHDGLQIQIGLVGRDLRRALTPILSAFGGADNPRPMRVARSLGLDKSLASRLVRALQTTSDLELVHIVPSPAGLRILAESATHFVDRGLIRELLATTERFENLLDSVPGGRAAIDAQISEGSQSVRLRSEQAARQSAFKSMSLLLGHFCDQLTTSLFLVPAENGRTVDGIEIHRRIGLRRMRPSTPLALMSLNMVPEEQPEDATRFESLDGTANGSDLSDFLIPEACTRPFPDLDVIQEGNLATMVLAGDPAIKAPARVASAFRIRNGWSIHPESSILSLRGYVLHVPCRRLVRDVYIAESLWPGAAPRISFALPGPRATTPPPSDTGPRHFTNVDLSVTIEQLPHGPKAFDVPGVSDHPAIAHHVLERAGHGETRFRGWRCAMTYPVPLIEMLWWITGHRMP